MQENQKLHFDTYMFKCVCVCACARACVRACFNARAATILVPRQGFQINTGGSCYHSNTIVRPPPSPPLPSSLLPLSDHSPPPWLSAPHKPESEYQRGERSARFVSRWRGERDKTSGSRGRNIKGGISWCEWW